ncbi:Non-specific serine/threonine protein kinase [Bertholletia excelsa]
MASPTSLLLLPCILTLALSLTVAQVCGPTANFSANSTFAQNRGLLLSSLATNVTAQDGFYSGSIGDGFDTVHGLALCRADISEVSCFDCINKSRLNTLKKCLNSTSSIDWGDQKDPRCITHYANLSLLGIMSTRPALFVWIQNNITDDLDKFNRALTDLVLNLSVTAGMATSKKFAVGARNYTESGKKVYALVQCTPDLTPSDCSECISGSLDDYRQCCKDSLGVNILRPSCIFRYSLSKFYNVDGSDLPVPPPPTVAVFSPLPSARNNSTEISFLPKYALMQGDYVDRLQRKVLNWDTRYKIIVGIAQGLLYLHEESSRQIIHRDLKAGNILLDDDMNPRIAGFGMARLLDSNQSTGQTKRIAEAFGKFSVKTDIFSFGVIMPEIVTRLKNGDYRGSDRIDNLLDYAWNNWRKGKALSLIDPEIVRGSRSEMMRCIHIGLLCAQENAAKRPPMSSVVLMLNCFSTSLPLPSKPGFWVHCGKESNEFLEGQLDRGARELDQSSERPANSSTNNVIISDYHPR